MSTPSIVVTIYIASTPEKVWNALTGVPVLERHFWLLNGGGDVGGKRTQSLNLILANPC